MSPGCFSERRQSAIWGESFWGYWAPNAPTWLQDQLAWWATVERYWLIRGTRSALLSWILPRYLCLHEKERGEEWGRGGGAITILMNYPTTSNMMPVRGPAMCIVYTCVSRPNFSTWLEEGAYELPRRSLWVVFICSWWKEPGGLHASLLFRWLARTNSVETVAHGIIDNIYYLWWDTSCSVAILTPTQSDRKIRVQFPGKVPIGHPS